jgi:hypothetical protein
MANIPENTTDPILRPVTRLETTTKVFGGEYIPDDEQQRGISNLQAIELAERDQYIISRVGQAKVDPSGDIPGEPGIAPLDTSGKLPKSNNTSGVVFTTDTQTLTNKTISYADNTMTGVVGTSATQTLTNKTISYADNTMPGVVGETATQTLTNKTIDAKDNVMLCTATNIISSQTITPTKQMMVTAGTSGITLTLGSGPYAGYALPILAVADCQVSYIGIDGAATETLDVGSYITFIWDATGSYWVVDAGAFEKPTYISTTQTLTAVKKMIAVVDTQGVVLTLDAGPYDGFELPVLATADCQIVYTGVNGSVTKNVQANTYNEFVWGGTYWLPRESTAITGIDDNGQPFAFNIDALTQADGVINITGTDANGNPFDYGVGKLVTVANENNYSTEEVKTSKTWIDGKPIYRKCYYVDSISYITGEAGYVVGTMPNNIGNVVKYGGCCRDGSGGAWLSIPYSINTWNGSSVVVNRSVNPYVDVNNSQVKLDIASNMPSTFYYIFIVLEYTKTTD